MMSIEKEFFHGESESEKIFVEKRLQQKPFLFDGEIASENGELVYVGDGMEFCNDEFREGEKIFIPDKRVFSFASLGIMGLIEELAESPFQEFHFKEMMKLNQAMNESDGLYAPPGYGNWAYYERDDALVQYLPEDIHILALVLRNSVLHIDPEMEMSWQEMREVFENTVPVVMGLSVGGTIAMAIEQLMRPKHMVLADMGVWSLPNTNRVPFLHYQNMLKNLKEVKETGDFFGRNKAIVLAEQMYGINPYRNKYVYSEGLGLKNFSDLLGNKIMPKATFVVDEADRLSDKTAMAEFCRKNRIRYIGVTDAWPFIILNVRAFDVDDSLPISMGVDDDDLYEYLRIGNKSQEGFFDFAERYVGKHLSEDYPFGRVIKGSLDWFGMGIPQPITAILYGAGLLTDRIALSLTGHYTSERIILNLLDLSILMDGEMVPPIKI